MEMMCKTINEGKKRVFTIYHSHFIKLRSGQVVSITYRFPMYSSLYIILVIYRTHVQ